MKLSISILLSLTLATLGACPAATAQEVKSEPMEQEIPTHLGISLQL